MRDSISIVNSRRFNADVSCVRVCVCVQIIREKYVYRHDVRINKPALMNNNNNDTAIVILYRAVEVFLSVMGQIIQDAQLSQRDRAAGCVIVFAKSRRLELGDNILRTV